MRPVDFVEDCGWMSDDVRLAHGIHFNDAEVRRLERNGFTANLSGDAGLE